MGGCRLGSLARDQDDMGCVGLVDAIEATLPGAAWQRCRTYYIKNLLTKVPRSAEAMTATMVRTIFAQPDPTRCGPSTTVLSTTSPTPVSPSPPTSSTGQQVRSSPSPGSPKPTGVRSGPSIPRNGFTRDPTSHQRRRDLPHPAVVA